MIVGKVFTGMAWDDPQDMIQQVTAEAHEWLAQNEDLIADYLVTPQTTCAVIPPDRANMPSRLRWLHTVTVTVEWMAPDGGLDADEEATRLPSVLIQHTPEPGNVPLLERYVGTTW